MVKDNDSRHTNKYELVLQHCTAQAMLLLQCVRIFFFLLSIYIPPNCTSLVKRITYFENEVLCKDTLVSHSSSTTHTKGYAWNATTKEDMAVIAELNTKTSLFIHKVTVRVSE